MRGSVRSDQGWKHITLLWRRHAWLGLQGISGDPHRPAGCSGTGDRDETPKQSRRAQNRHRKEGTSLSPASSHEFWLARWPGPPGAMEVLTTHPGLLQLETRGDRCHLGKDRERGGRGCWASTYSSPGHRAAPPGPEPGGPRQPALPEEVTRLGSIGLQCREVIWEDEGALVLGVHLPGRESGSGADGAVGEPGRLGPWWYLAVGPGGPGTKRVVGVPAGDILRGWLLQLPLPGSLHPVGRHQHPVIPQRVVTSVLVLCGERRAGRQGGRNAGRRPPPTPPPRPLRG